MPVACGQSQGARFLALRQILVSYRIVAPVCVPEAGEKIIGSSEVERGRPFRDLCTEKVDESVDNVGKRFASCCPDCVFAACATQEQGMTTSAPSDVEPGREAGRHAMSPPDGSVGFESSARRPIRNDAQRGITTR